MPGRGNRQGWLAARGLGREGGQAERDTLRGRQVLVWVCGKEGMDQAPTPEKAEGGRWCDGATCTLRNAPGPYARHQTGRAGVCRALQKL